MKELVIALFGNYELQYNGDNLVGGIAGLDYEWLFGAFLFVITLYSLYKMIGVIFKRAFG